MTHQQKQEIKRNLPTWLTLANLVLLLSLSFSFGSVKSDMENGIKSNTVNIEEHKLDESVHMPFEKKIEVFVPRVELDNRMKNMEDSLKRIEEKLDK